MTRLSHNRRRTGFTLIELLVVVAIIAILAALVTAAAGRVRLAQTVKATEQSLTKLRLGVDQQWKAVLDQAREEGRRAASPQTIPVEVWAWCNNDRDRTTALWGYIKLRLEFPQTFPEARNGVTINGIVIPPKHTFAQLPDVAPTSLAEYRLQSAVLLYLIMSERGGRGMVFSADDVTNGDVTLTDSLGVAYGTFRAFKDAWGMPICFERFTTAPDANQRPLATPFRPRANIETIDPLDPMYKLADGVNWDSTGTRKTLSEVQVMPPLPPRGATPDTPAWFYTFDIRQNRMCAMISFGPDKNMDATPTSGDDLYSFRVHRPGNTSN